MTPFPLKILTPGGAAYDGPAEALIVPTVTGQLGILAGHVSCVAPLTPGRATVVAGNEKRHAACSGGMVSVLGGYVTLLTPSFSWNADSQTP